MAREVRKRAIRAGNIVVVVAFLVWVGFIVTRLLTDSAPGSASCRSAFETVYRAVDETLTQDEADALVNATYAECSDSADWLAVAESYRGRDTNYRLFSGGGADHLGAQYNMPGVLSRNCKGAPDNDLWRACRTSNGSRITLPPSEQD